LIKAVLFDYGGTLVQPRRPWEEVKPTAVAASHAVLRRHGLKESYDKYVPFDASTFDKYTELEKQTKSDIPDIVPYREIVGTLFPNSSRAWRQRVAAEANNAFWKVAVANYGLQRGTRKCLTELKSMKLRLAVVSNHHHPEALINHLTRLGLRPYFSRIIASSRVGFRKPDQRIFAMCLSALRVLPLEAVFVGDLVPVDIVGAKRAGMTTILIGNDDRSHEDGKPDFKVVDLSEVPGIVSSLQDSG
jgi:HAD superfamily hydrolase (TIGR01509 family)